MSTNTFLTAIQNKILTYGQDESDPSADKSTRQPTAGEHTIIGFQVRRSNVGAKGEEVYPASTKDQLQKEIQYAGDVIFLTPQDLLTTERTAAPGGSVHAKYRTTLTGVPIGSEIIPIAFIPKTEKPYQNAGRSNAVGNASVTGTFLVYSRFKDNIPEGESLMAVAPTADMLHVPISHDEAKGEFRPILIPCGEIIKDCKDYDVLVADKPPSMGITTNRLKRSQLTALLKQMEKSIGLPSKSDKFKKSYRDTMTAIVNSSMEFGRAVERERKVLSLEPLLNDGTPGLCQWTP